MRGHIDCKDTLFFKNEIQNTQKNYFISPHHHLPFLLSLQILTKQKHPYFKHPKHNQINKIYETRKSQTSQKIFELIKENPNISTQEMADYIGIDRRNITRQIKKLQDKGIISRIGPDKGGYWEILLY